MAQVLVHVLEMTDLDVREFMNAYKKFMSDELVPIWLGVSSIKFKVEVAKEGYALCCETNKTLNVGSTQRVRQLSVGFLGGWLAHKGETNPVARELEQRLKSRLESIEKIYSTEQGATQEEWEEARSILRELLQVQGATQEQCSILRELLKGK